MYLSLRIFEVLTDGSTRGDGEWEFDISGMLSKFSQNWWKDTVKLKNSSALYWVSHTGKSLRSFRYFWKTHEISLELGTIDGMVLIY